MYLKRVKAKNFRQFEDFELELNKGMNLIVGENNSGKTTLIDAIRFVLDTNSAEWIRLKESDFRSGTSELHIQLEFHDLKDEEAAVFVEHLNYETVGEDERRSFLFVNLRASITKQIYRGTNFLKTEICSGKGFDGPLIEREARQYLTTTYLKPLRDAENELSAGKASRLSQVLASAPDLGGDKAKMEALIQIFIEANSKIKGHDGIQLNREKIKKILKDTTFRSDEFQPVIDVVGSKPLSDMSEPEKMNVFRAILEKLSLSLDNTSKTQGMGYNNLLFMVTELLLLENGEEGFPLLLVEEPEAHLHPQLQMKFLAFLRNKQDDLQCILTTHSPNLASKAPLESIIILNGGEAYSLRKGNTQLDNDDYLFLEKFLDVTKSNMFFAKSVLIVEGDGENILLPTIAELIGRHFEDFGVSIVNVGSTAYKRFAKIYKTTRPEAGILPVKVACVTDLDLWPDKAEKVDVNSIGFKERKSPNKDGRGGNEKRWLSYYNDKDDEKIAWVNKRKEFDGQNVKTFVSDEWTFEYCLARYGLAEEVYCAVNGSDDGFENLPEDIEERAIAIYGLIDGKSSRKTEVTYNLIALLQQKYNKEDLLAKLPPYIIKAIAHVTEPFETGEENVEQKEQTVQVGMEVIK